MEYFLYFIVNKQSRNSKAVFKKLLIELPKHKINYKFLITESISQLDTLLSQLQSTVDPTDMFVVVGGDGSLNQFVTFYIKYQFKNAIGYIPAGSGNDFARAHHIPLDTVAALQHLFTVEKVQKLSIILASHGNKKHVAVNSIGFGIDGLIGHLIETKGKKEKLGASSYLFGVFSGFLKQKKFSLTLTLDDSVHIFNHVQLALVANNPSFAGGVYIVPDASGKDELLEVLIADNVSPRDLATIMTRLVTNQTHTAHPKIHLFQSKEINIRINSSQYAQKDGEVFYQKTFNYHFQTEKLSFWI